MKLILLIAFFAAATSSVFAGPPKMKNMGQDEMIENEDGTAVIIGPRMKAFGKWRDIDWYGSDKDGVCKRFGYTTSLRAAYEGSGCFARDQVVIGPTGAVTGLLESGCVNDKYQISTIYCSGPVNQVD